MIGCNVCEVTLVRKMHLLNHAESVHGAVSRVPMQLPPGDQVLYDAVGSKERVRVPLLLA